MKTDYTEEQKRRVDEAYMKVAKRINELAPDDSKVEQSLPPIDKAVLLDILHELELGCLTLMPDYARGLACAATLYQRLGDNVKALALMERACQVDTQSAGIALAASQAADDVNDLDKALYYAREAVNREPDQPDILVAYAMKLLDAGRDEEASKVLDKAILIGQNHPVSQDILLAFVAAIYKERERPPLEDFPSSDFSDN
ncbi:tetratricopeptide repeat protein [Mangrovibacterium lignilyticum]|uniref:tetratricopeptide repeat protein n=1 Tax=Mangrovibacterium lignilyticum TaxID=2668052 RepID=UPI0013D14621|nr:tetratricopeptide repeat protein [Mangrovibacterium lignilyticum]